MQPFTEVTGIIDRSTKKWRGWRQTNEKISEQTLSLCNDALHGDDVFCLRQRYRHCKGHLKETGGG